jgi:hypothetical protein
MLKEIYLKLAEFVSIIINDVNVGVIHNYGNNERPRKPFILISIENFDLRGFPNKYEIDDVGLQRLVFFRKFTVKFEAFADDRFTACDLLMTIDNGFYTHFASDYFQDEIVHMRTVNGIDFIGFSFDGMNESRAIMMCEFNSNMEIKDNVGLIEHVNITDLDTGNEFIINK